MSCRLLSVALFTACTVFATQSFAGTVINSSKSNNFKQAKQTGGTTADKAMTVNGTKSNTYRQGTAPSGGGTTPAGAASINNSKSNTYRQ
jgi:hypothetical protein